MNRELLISDLRRFQRLYSPVELPSIIANYVAENYIEQLDKAKADDGHVHHDKVIGLICGHFQKSLGDIIEAGQGPAEVLPRKLLCYLLWKRTYLVQKNIAELLRYKDHTSVLHHRDATIDQMQSDSTFRDLVELLNSQL